MATKNFKQRPSGSHGPKAVGAILDEMLQSDSCFAAYRRYKEAAETDQLFRDLWPQTEFPEGLKLLTRKPGRIPVGTHLQGVLTRDGEDHFLFVQNADKVKTAQRTPVIFRGECVNVHLLGEKAKRLAFTQPLLDTSMSFRNFCLHAAEELIMIARLLGREEGYE